MTREQFIRGYLLLTTQPWGKTYRSAEPAAEIQMEFYYQALSKYDAFAWLSVCEIHATGEHWPSLDALKTTLKQQRPVALGLPAPDGQYITKEQFGVNLYEVIKAIGGIMAIDEHRATVIHQERPKELPDLNVRRLTLQKHLASLLPTLTDDEMAQVVARYPLVVGL